MYKNIILITPCPITHRTAEENIGLGYLAAVLRKEGYAVQIIDGWLEGLSNDLIVSRVLLVCDPLYIGFSCYRSNMEQAIQICRELRNNGVSCPFVAGGFGPTFYTNEFLQNGFDIIVRGEAERVILELTNTIVSGNLDYSKLNGVSYTINNIFYNNSAAELIVDLDQIPFPARDTLQFAIKRKSPINILSSRGCMANCIFCSIAAFQKVSLGNKWRERSIANFVDEIESLYQNGARNFKVVDDSFIEPPRDAEWCYELANEILNRGLLIRLRGSIRADRVTDEIIYQLKRAGFYSFSCGIENGSAAALHRMGKPAKLIDNLRALEVFDKYNIYVQAGFILFDPFTTVEELGENIIFLEKFNNIITKGIFTEMYAAAGTPFSNLLNKTGELNSDLSNHGNSFYVINDYKVRLIYNALKIWQKSHTSLYDKAIDPISAPKAIEESFLKEFYLKYLELRKIDLIFFKKILYAARDFENPTQQIDEILQAEINSTNSQHITLNKEIDYLYQVSGLEYDAVENPFIC